MELGHHSGVDAPGGCVPASRRGTVGVRCCSSWAVAVMPVCPGPLVADPQGMTRSIRLALLLLPLACAALPSLARAQTSCPGAASGAVTTTARQWPAPLDRLVTLHEREVSLRDALDRLAAAARVRLAYSADLLPLDRRVCAVYRSVAVGTALTELLEGVAVEPVVADSDRVVLAPASTLQAAAAPGPTLTRRTDVLERVVVTGTVNGSAQRAVPVALDVIDGRELQATRRALTVQRPQRRRPRSLGLGAVTDQPARELRKHPRRQLVRLELSKGLHRRHRGRELTSHHGARCRVGRPCGGHPRTTGRSIVRRRRDQWRGQHRDTSRRGRWWRATRRVADRRRYGRQHLRTERGAHPASFNDAEDRLRCGSASLGLSASTLGDFIPDAFDHRFTINGTGRRVARSTIISGIVRFLAEDAASPPSPLLATRRGRRLTRHTARGRLRGPPVCAPVHVRRHSYGAPERPMDAHGSDRRRRVQSQRRIGIRNAVHLRRGFRPSRGTRERRARNRSSQHCGAAGDVESSRRGGHARARAFRGSRGQSPTHDVRAGIAAWRVWGNGAHRTLAKQYRPHWPAERVVPGHRVPERRR